MVFVSGRVGEFGALGSYLHDLLPELGDVTESYADLELTEQLIKFATHSVSLRGVHPLGPVAVSLLCVAYPVQCDFRLSDLTAVLRHSFSFLPQRAPLLELTGLIERRVTLRKAPATIGALHTKVARLCNSDSAARSQLWPPKRHAAAGTKVNIRLAPLAVALSRSYGPAWLGRALTPLVGCAEDAVCCALLLATALEPHFGHLGLEVAQSMILEPNNAKGLSNALKALGWNSTLPGSMLVEGGALQGRGVSPVDMDAEIASRTTPDLVTDMVISSAAEMAPHIRAILALELPSNSGLGDLDEFWSARWLWCVNGAQNRASDRSLNLPSPVRGAKRYRRMAAEEVSSNPIYDWDGTTNVSASTKLEPGKSRAIFACDTSSYFAFSWILDRAQRDWRGHRVLLNPGEGGLYGVARRVKGAQGRGGVNVMLDYDDFNSHHSLGVQQELTRQLCQLYNAPSWYTSVLVDSFDRMYITHRGSRKRILGTLMSGHRGTSFINSVLNAAYIRAAVGGAFFDRLVSLHAGDDAYMRCSTLAEAAHVLTRCARFGCRMNPTKQSIGFRHAEFLRLGIGDKYAVGYLCRSISTLVAGSWVAPDPLSPEDGLTSAITTVRSCINRGCPSSLSRIIARTYSSIHGYPLRVLDALLSGAACLESGAVYNTDYTLRQYRVVRPLPDDLPLPPQHREYATREYLANHVSPIEARAAQLASADLVRIMVRSSYSKGVTRHPSSPTSRRRPQLVSLPTVKATGFTTAAELAKRQPPVGKLANFPLLRLIEARLTDDQISELLSFNGTPPGGLPPRIAAFGVEGHCCNVIGYLPYSDACSYSKRTTCDNIIAGYSVYS
ncbi:RNA dependent RNA polymerase [Tolypocladium cylindrosporum virus 1]|uniref:RNA-directed RNA polymerase n=1 Tax=Tolypocladium cylindrosporum virus 1 TaxID=939923 RepID=E7BBP7_9VIRU|nr:RNA dependent RNA polymerase [Tolypocladium cylindrosporum virus 1]CBY84992.1 RNA dependent RNA polymerase [Tolypocladium cylindrosporum virus 1]